MCAVRVAAAQRQKIVGWGCLSADRRRYYLPRKGPPPMYHKDLIVRAAGVGACAAAFLLATTHANGEPSRSKGQDREEALSCSSNYQSGLDREQSGHLIEASELFL